jgi:hypothetical protein
MEFSDNNKSTPSRNFPSRGIGRLYSLIGVLAAFSLLIAAAGCTIKNAESDYRKSEKVQSQYIRPAPAAGPLTVEVNEAAGNSSTLSEIRRSGIVRASIDCARPPLCFKDKFGVARGFEVDLLRQTAAALGVKLNIVPQGSDAPISGPFTFPPEKHNSSLLPYYYTAKTGWLAFQINGDKGFRNAVELILNHLYDTGTYQQLFINRSIPIQQAGGTLNK